MGIFCMTQGTLNWGSVITLGMGWGRRWEGGSGGRGHVYTYG